MSTNTVKKTVKPRGQKPGAPSVRKGIPNKATADARKAIGEFVDGNAHRLVGWLDLVAEGIMQPDGEKFTVAPNPAKAFELFQSVIEYHVPKLARTEHTGKDGDVIRHQVITRTIIDPRAES